MIVTHPFHPLAGQRVSMLFERTYRNGLGRVFICDGGPLGTVTLPEDFTDRGAPPASGPVTAEALCDLAAIVSALRGRLTSGEPESNLV